jgi:hypothetical protein
MPTIRFTYDRDVARFGDRPVEVPEVTARRLVADRRAVLVADADNELCGSLCPEAACETCPASAQ